MTKEQTKIIKEKKQLFKDFCIRWDETLETKFLDECAKHPNSDPHIIADRLCHDALVSRHRLGVFLK